MANHPKGQHRVHCTFADANLRGTCPHYAAGHYGYECRGFEQAITHFGNLTVYHCKHDQPRPEQAHLPL